jgi:ketosteroid isomerase-like protein
VIATDPVEAYYDSWKYGAEHFDEDRLREVLDPNLDFFGSIAGHRTGAEGFIRGVGDIARALKSFRMIQLLRDGNQAAAIYECELTRPEGTFRFAEFFTVENGRIVSLNLCYDGTEFRKLSPAPPQEP